jgi:hypothetical protein
MPPLPPRVRFTAPLLMAMIAATAVPMALASQAPSLGEVIKRVTVYAEHYGPRLASIVAEEHYTQWVERESGTAGDSSLGDERRVIRSDFVLTRPDDAEWVAFRDAFEVDGLAVRGREDRLVALLSAGGDSAWQKAAAIANESARYNIGSGLITRNINVPTFPIQLLRSEHRERFGFSRPKQAGDGDSRLPATRADVPPRWEVEYRERRRPTIVRQRSGEDQPLRGTISVDPATGEVWASHLTWERGPGGHISVTYDRVPDVDTLVPVRMVEEYRAGRTVIRGEAVYSNFRRFRTSARVLSPRPR